MEPRFPEIKKKLGFGCMRLPMEGGSVDRKQVSEMVDVFLDRGFNYFDTAHGYLGGRSERAVRECLASRYPREKFILTDKLTENFFKKERDIRPFFEDQLRACGTEYFDFYLMHAQSKGNYDHFVRCRAYETAAALKAEGRIRHVGISFHDNAAFLDKILTEHPEIEVVQIQLNYVDFEDPVVQSRLCYEVCVKHGKPVIVMEPVKGGRLADPPAAAKGLFSALGSASPASYAVRFAAGFENVCMVLSGMSTLGQMKENVSFMENFQPLNEEEMRAVGGVRAVFAGANLIPCTACRYCTDGCPKKIAIPDLFGCMNAKKLYRDWNSSMYYGVHTREGGKASDCIACGKCEHVCPQHLPIRALLRDVARQFES